MGINIRLDFDEDMPIYRQIMMEIERAIARGELAPGERLPSQREMAVLSGTNPNTVQRAYREMELEGVIETRRGRGTFVREDSEAILRIRRQLAPEAVDAFIAKMKSLGLTGQMIRQIVADRLEGEDPDSGKEGRDDA